MKIIIKKILPLAFALISVISLASCLAFSAISGMEGIGISPVEVSVPYDEENDDYTDNSDDTGWSVSSDNKTLSFRGVTYESYELPANMALSESNGTMYVDSAWDGSQLLFVPKSNGKDIVRWISPNGYSFLFATKNGKQKLSVFIENEEYTKYDKITISDAYATSLEGILDPEYAGTVLSLPKTGSKIDVTINSGDLYLIYGFGNDCSLISFLGGITRTSYKTMVFIPADEFLKNDFLENGIPHLWRLNKENNEDGITFKGYPLDEDQLNELYTITTERMQNTSDRYVEYVYLHSGSSNIFSPIMWNVIFWILYALLGVVLPGAIAAYSLYEIYKKGRKKPRFIIMASLSILWIGLCLIVILMLAGAGNASETVKAVWKTIPPLY